jgi:hypothetical protein
LAKTARNMFAPAQQMAFSGGPYNPLGFKSSLVPEQLPS